MSKSIYIECLIADRQRNGGIQKIYKFENGRGASVIRNPFSYGGEEGLYELAVLDENGNLDYTTPITDDVVGWLKWEEVIELLRQINELENEEDN